MAVAVTVSQMVETRRPMTGIESEFSYFCKHEQQWQIVTAKISIG
jgi:hypothetical protein